MSEVNPKEGVAITYPVGEITSSTSSFDEDVKARIKAMAETGWMPEGTEYFNRRVKDLIIQLMGRERTGTFIDVLGCVEKSNPKLALNIKYDALRGLESVNSGAEEAPAPEQTRYHILGSAAFQLIADSRLPESEQIFSAPDILQFFTNHFSFETRTHLAGILNLYGGLSNELQEVIRKEFGLPDFHNTSDPTGEDRQETKFSGNSAGRAPSALAEPEHMEHYDSSEMSLEEIQVQHTLRAICERIQSIAEINDAQIVQSTKRSDGVYCSLSEEIAKAMGWDKVEMVFSHPTRFTQGISTPRAGIACYSQQKETQQVDGDEYEVVNLKRTYVFNVMDDPNSANYGKHSVLIHDHEALGDGLGGLTSPDAKELENLWLSIEKATTEMLFRTVTKDFVVNESTKKVEELTKSVASKLDQINTPQEAH
ncbi:hypothetical protein HY857_00055, partial [Candidatus Saccharibacteria bacterium]|nr:hypothetical protein [Candidatus Saccharibacteria bacterium]